MIKIGVAVLAILFYILNLSIPSVRAYKCSLSDKFRVLNCSGGYSGRFIPGTDRVMPTIYLNSSKILDITDDAFDAVTELQRLYLNDNFIAELKPRWFQNLKNLHMVDMSRNQITTYVPGTFQHTRFLVKLYLGNNAFQSFDGRFDNFARTTVDLSNNPLTEVQFDRLHTLHINNTNVTSLDIITAVNIYAEYSKIENFSAKEGVVDKLHLRGNNMQDLSNLTESFAQLQYLDLSQNFIGSIGADAFLNLKGLRHLNISKIDLYHMYYGMFSSQRALEVLDMSDNYLWHLNLNKVFPARLRELYVLGNAIWKITDSRKILRSLEKLGIAGNELSCERLFKIYYKGTDRGVEFYTPPQMANYTGDNIAGMPCRNVI